MRGIKAICALITLLLLNISIIPTISAPVNTMKFRDDELNENTTSLVKLFEHNNNSRYGSDCLLPYPQDKEHEMYLDSSGHELIFKLPKFDNNYDLVIKGGSKLIFQQYCSGFSWGMMFSSSIEITFTLSYDNVTTLVRAGDTFSLGESSTCCEIETTFPDEDFVIKPQTHNLYLKINFLGSPHPFLSSYKTYFKYSGVYITIKEPLRLEFDIENKAKEKQLHINALATTPFGGEGIKSCYIHIEGIVDSYRPHDDLTYTNANGSIFWIWDYGKINAKPGKYIIELHASTPQYLESDIEYEFILRDRAEEEAEDLLYLAMFYAFIGIIASLIGIVFILYFRKRNKLQF